MPKRILCYGDSNTWGYIPTSGGAEDQRYSASLRWTGLLQANLGSDFLIIEEGLNSRTTDVDDPDQPGKNGLTALAPTLQKHLPIDMLIVALGTNDLKSKYDRTPERIAQGLSRLIEAAQGALGSATKLVVLSPSIPVLAKTYEGYRYPQLEQKARGLAPLYRAVAQKHNADFIDLAPSVPVSLKDGIHLEPDQHRTIAERLAPFVASLMP